MIEHTTMTDNKQDSQEMIPESTQETSVSGEAVQEKPIQETPVSGEAVQEKPMQETPASETAVQEKPMQEAPVSETAAQEVPAQEAPAQAEIPVVSTKSIEKNLYLQYNNLEFSDRLMFEAAINDYCEKNGVPAGEIEVVNLYVKPEEGKAYYVINQDGEKAGFIDL